MTDPFFPLFQGTKPTSSSNLFSHVGTKQSSKLASKPKVKPQRTKQSPIVINDDVEIIEDSPRPQKSQAKHAKVEDKLLNPHGNQLKPQHFEDQKQKKPHEKQSKTLEARNLQTPVKQGDALDSEMIPDTPAANASTSDFSDIVPDTPDSEQTLPVQKRKFLQGRSFLSSSNILKTGGGPTVKSKVVSNETGSGRVIKIAKRLSSSEKLQRSLAGECQKWDMENASLNTILTDNGLPNIADIAKSTGVDKLKVESLNGKVRKPEAVNFAIRGKMMAEASKAASAKRVAESSTGASPDLKRSFKKPDSLKAKYLW